MQRNTLDLQIPPTKRKINCLEDWLFQKRRYSGSQTYFEDLHLQEYNSSALASISKLNSRLQATGNN
jgi:hypothetical protein